MRTLGRSLAVTLELCRHEALSHGRLGIPYGLAVVGPIVEFFGGLALVLGVATPWAALALIAFTLVATGIGHRFWEYDGPPRVAQVINFEKNMAMVGGLLALFVAGPGSFSFDHLFARRGSS
jgi:putative oxidoreductase